MQLILDEMKELKSLLIEQGILKKDVLSLEEAGKYLDFSKSTLYKLTSNREIPFYCPHGKRIYFKRQELDLWLLRNKSISNSEAGAQALNYLSNKKKCINDK
jgi:excisionase family DNA binding protein